MELDFAKQHPEKSPAKAIKIILKIAIGLPLCLIAIYGVIYLALYSFSGR
jgi:hypothetical protein